MQAFDDPKLQRAPMGQRLMLMTRKVQVSLHKPDAAPCRANTITLNLEAPQPQSFIMPTPGSLADSFERTPDPIGDKSVFEQVLEWAESLLSRNGKVK